MLHRDVVACRGLHHHELVAVLVADVYEVDPSVRFVEVDELRLGLLSVCLPDVGVRRLAFNEDDFRTLLEQVVDRCERHHRLPRPLASAYP